MTSISLIVKSTYGAKCQEQIGALLELKITHTYN